MTTYPSVTDVPETIDMATVYVPPEIGITLLDGFEKKQIGEIWINPGAESDELIAEARRRKLNVIEACSIVGYRPQSRIRCTIDRPISESYTRGPIRS